MILPFIPTHGWPTSDTFAFDAEEPIPDDARALMSDLVEEMAASDKISVWEKAARRQIVENWDRFVAFVRLVIEFSGGDEQYGFDSPLCEKAYRYFQKPLRGPATEAYAKIRALVAQLRSNVCESGLSAVDACLRDSGRFRQLLDSLHRSGEVAFSDWPETFRVLDLVLAHAKGIGDSGSSESAWNDGDDGSETEVVIEPEWDGSDDDVEVETPPQIVLNEHQAAASRGIVEAYAQAQRFLARRRADFEEPSEKELKAASATKYDLRYVIPGLLAISGSAGVGKTTTFLDTVIRLFEGNPALRSVMPCAYTHNAAGEIRKQLKERVEQIHHAYESVDAQAVTDTLETTINDRKVELPIWRIRVNGIMRTIVRPNTIMSTFSSGRADDEGDEDGFGDMGTGHPFDLIAIDEASMPPASMIRRLALNSHAPILLLGDPGQIPPIETNKGQYDYFTSAILHGFRGMLRYFRITSDGPGYHVERVSYRFSRPVNDGGECVLREDVDAVVGENYQAFNVSVDVPLDNPLTGFQLEGSGSGKILVAANRGGFDQPMGYLFAATVPGDGRPLVCVTNALSGFGDLMDAPSQRTAGESGGILDLAFRVRRHTDLPHPTGIQAAESLDVRHAAQPLARIEGYVREAIAGGRGVQQAGVEEAVREFATRYLDEHGAPSGDGVFICGRHATRSSLNQRVRARLMDGLVGVDGPPVDSSDYLSAKETLIVEGARKLRVSDSVVLANNEFLRVRRVHDQEATLDVEYVEWPNRLGMGASGLDVGEVVPATIHDEPARIPVVEAEVETRDGSVVNVTIPHWFLGRNGTSAKDRRVWEEAYREGYYRLRSRILDILKEIRLPGPRQKKGWYAYPLLALFDPREYVEIPRENWTRETEMREQSEEVQTRHALGVPMSESYVGRKWIEPSARSFPLGPDVEALAAPEESSAVIHVLLDELNAVLKQLGHREVRLGMQTVPRYQTVPVRRELLVALYGAADLPTGHVSGEYLENVYRRPVESVMGEPFALDLRQRIHLMHGQFSISFPSYVLRYKVDRGASLHTMRHIETARQISGYQRTPVLIAHYGYAVTGHASQGSEFPTVYAALDPGSLRLVQKAIDESNPKQLDERYRYMQEVLRWIYVVCTRARNTLTFIDFAIAKHDPEKPVRPVALANKRAAAEIEASLGSTTNLF